MGNHVCGDWCDCPSFPMEVTTSDPTTMEQSLTDRKIQHCVRDIQRAVEEGCFQVETPRVVMEQDDLLGLTVGWSRDTKFVRSHTASPGPMQVDFSFDAAVEETEFYEDIERDMAAYDFGFEAALESGSVTFQSLSPGLVWDGGGPRGHDATSSGPPTLGW